MNPQKQFFYIHSNHSENSLKGITTAELSLVRERKLQDYWLTMCRTWGEPWPRQLTLEIKNKKSELMEYSRVLSLVIASDLLNGTY